MEAETVSIELKKEQMHIYLLHSTELMRLETAQNRSLKPASEVLVQKLDPVEIDLKWARVVQANMQRGIAYRYFFCIDKGADPKCRIHIAHLLRAIAICNCLDEKTLGEWETNEADRLSIVNVHVDAVRKTLEKIKQQLFIGFVPFKVWEEFRIHNADSEQMRGYLRWLGTNYFMQVNKEQARLKVEAYQRFRHHSDHTIFGSTADLPLYKVEQELHLREALKEVFTDRLIGGAADSNIAILLPKKDLRLDPNITIITRMIMCASK